MPIATGAEIQLWHTTLDLTTGLVTFRNGGSPLATTTVVVAELLGRERTTSCSCSSFFASGTEKHLLWSNHTTAKELSDVLVQKG
ncbi:hypothetical protein L1987_51947 [Smallanthus sonchifolius]|uniref:Uncharacterized protein n=1 Tax=Smallanthus sonchifolius TaxID=185202 RepID=A0ACB9ER75_9ASTR|nr:hypothetical protein L1987_51947 [Smallanthus sonchifolius]